MHQIKHNSTYIGVLISIPVIQLGGGRFEPLKPPLYTLLGTSILIKLYTYMCTDDTKKGTIFPRASDRLLGVFYRFQVDRGIKRRVSSSCRRRCSDDEKTTTQVISRVTR